MQAKAEQLGIYGGTFDPVHHGHLIAARAAFETLNLDRLLLVPNRVSPLRLEERPASGRDRLEMAARAVAGEPGFGVCDLEVTREGPSYLIDTLEALAEGNPGADLVFLMGGDSLRTFDRWVRAADIVRRARVCVMPRPGDQSERLLRELEARSPRLAGGIELLPEGPELEISATDIRERVRTGRSIRYLVPDSVADWIRERGLYR